MKTFVWCALTLVLLTSSCVMPNYYSPALSRSNIAYQPKPMRADSVKSAVYASASINGAYGDNIADQLSYGEFDISRGHSFKALSLSYGVFGFAGNINNGKLQDNEPFFFRRKHFAGYGGRASISYLKSFGRTDFRMPGLEIAYSKELGDYADFRRDVHEQPLFYSNTRTELVTVGLSSEIIWHARRNINVKHSFRLFIGNNLGRNSFEHWVDPRRVISKNGTQAWFSYGLNVYHVFGVIETSGFSSARFSLGYRF